MNIMDWTLIVATLLNGIAAVHNLGVNRKLKEQQVISEESDSNEVVASTIKDILESAKEIIKGYKELAVDIENENKIRDKKIKVLQESLSEAEQNIFSLKEENENLKRISVATIAGVEVLVSQLKKEGIEPIWEISPKIYKILKSVSK